MKAGRV